MSDWKEIPYTANRYLIYDLLQRARRFHCPVTGNMEVDVTDTIARIDAEHAAGRDAGIIAYLARATALTIRRHPKLQRHIFTTWYGRPREVQFDRIHCTLIVARENSSGEEILLPLNLQDTDKMSIEDIHRAIREHKQKPVQSLEQLKAIEKVKQTPRIGLSWFSYKARSDPDFYLKYFGTYGLSSLLQREGPVNAISAVANTAVAFLPTSLRERPWVVKGQIVPRTILNIAVVVDHYLIDGGESLKIAHTLKGLLEDSTEILGPAGTAAHG